MARRRWIPAALAVACYVLAILQRPGEVVADTKVDLYVDPHGFLADVVSAWTSQVQLGHVFGGQYGGYLFPMAPWFAVGDSAGIPTWLVHRLWLGTLLALAAWGMVRLLDALLDRARGAPHVAAAVVFVLNPYVAVLANRTSISLLAYAALPWMLLAVHRGLRDPRGWRWPAFFALALTCTGGGVNLAVTSWVLLGPLIMLVYEVTVGGVARSAILPFLVRLAPITLLANVWWLAPAFVHLRYGLDFLAFTEQPGTIWQTTSVTESLRMMGFWTSYIGSGFTGTLRPFASHAPSLLFDPAVLVASLLIPAAAIGGFAWTGRWRYGPLFLLLVLAGLLVMVVGFPEGTPLRRALTFTYNQVESVRFLRTTYKAGPLLAVGIAALAGGVFGVAWDRARRARVARPALAAAALAVCAVAAWPLTSGTAPERQLVVDVPRWTEQAAREIDRIPEGRRAMVLPGGLFGYYDWGGTIDPILPTLAERPVAERVLVPFADLRAVDLQFATDALISQERVLPGQLPSLLELMGVGAVATNNESDLSRSGALGAVEAADALTTGGVAPSGPQTTTFGPRRREHAAVGHVHADEELPRLTVTPRETDGMVQLLPRDALTVVDGGAEGIAALAGFGALDPDRPLAYAADLDAEAIRAADEVVITDTNRRQAFVAARLRANRGAVLPADQALSEDGAMLDPFGEDPDAQTVTVVEGVEAVRAPFSPQLPQTPESRPYAAIDGDEDTAWLADRALARDRHWIEIDFDEPRDLGTIEVLPYGDPLGQVTELEVDGERVEVEPGWNEIAVDRRDVASLRIAVTDVTEPPTKDGGAGGIREIRIPGLEARELLRPPVLAERALDGQPPRGALSYLFSRQTTDAPQRMAPPSGALQRYLLRDRTDPEPRLLRIIAPPTAREWRADAWTRPDPATADDVLDRLARTEGPSITSSGRAGGRAEHRGSRAFDGDPATAWIAPWVDAWQSDAPRRASLTVELERPVAIRRLRLVAPEQVVRHPTRVRVRAGGAAATADVGPEGTVVLPRDLRGGRVTIEVLDARFPAATGGRERQRRAVGIAEVEGIPGARVVDAPSGAPLDGRCGDARIVTAAGPVDLRPQGTVGELEAGTALHASACGGAFALPAGQQVVEGADGALDVDHLRLRSAAPGGTPAVAAPGTVVDPGSGSRGERDGVEVDVRAPAWLVLGESYNVGWRATCDGRDLGEPVPLQGYANAWPVEPGCRQVAFTWAPNAALPPAYVVSLVTCLLLLAGLAVAAVRRRAGTAGAEREAGARGDLPADRPARWGWRGAAVAGLAAGAILAFAFGLRTGPPIAAGIALVLAYGVSAKRLALAAGALLGLVVPILYLAVPAEDAGGYGSNVAVDRIAAHWVGVAAVVLAMLALWRMLAAARARQ